MLQSSLVDSRPYPIKKKIGEDEKMIREKCCEIFLKSDQAN